MNFLRGLTSLVALSAAIVGCSGGESSNDGPSYADGTPRPVGDAFTLNLASFNASSPVVAALPQAGFVASWTSSRLNNGFSDNGVFARLFSGTDVPASGELTVNNDEGAQNGGGVVAGLRNGGFAIAWTNGTLLQQQQFSSSGSPIGQVEKIAIGTGGQSITALSDGGYVVAWITAGFYIGREFDEIFVRRYDATGQAVGGNVSVASEESIINLDSAALIDGGFVLVWDESTFNGENDSYSYIFSRQYGASGVPEGPKDQIATKQISSSTGFVREPSVTALLDGGFAVSWADSDGSSSTSIGIQRFDAGGAQVGQRIRYDNACSASFLSSLGDGGFVLAGGGNTCSYAGEFNSIAGQRYSSSGALVGDRFDYEIGSDITVVSSISTLSDGDFIVAATANDGGGTADRAIVQRFTTSIP